MESLIALKGRVAKLEEKLDSLVTLLHDASNRAPVAEPTTTTPPSSSSSSSIVDAILRSAAQSSRPLRRESDGIEMRNETPIRISEPSYVSLPQLAPRALFYEMDEQKANRLLDRFRTMTDFFPFVVVPQTVDARTLLGDRPLLYRTIMAAAERNVDVQKDQVTDIMQYLALHVFQLGEKNLDLLLGVLVHIAWSQFHIHIMPRLTQLLHQALALLFDLGLNKSPPANQRALDSEERSSTRCRNNRQDAVRTLEERRAALACFYLVSGSASYIQNIEPMRWTAYLEDCLLQLQESNQYSTDPLLVIYVRMQCMAEKVDSNSWFDDTEQLPGWKFYPPILHIRALKAQLQILGKDLETEFPQDARLFSHYYNVEMTLYEIGLSKTLLPSTASSGDFPRLEILYACLESVRKFFEHFLEIPPASYWNLTLVNFSNLATAISMLQRLSFFEDPTWDLNYVAEKVSFVYIVDQICNRLAEAQRSGGTEAANASKHMNMFARTEAKMRNLKVVFEAQISSMQSSPDQIERMKAAEMMDVENMAGFSGWENDWFDIMGTNWDGS